MNDKSKNSARKNTPAPTAKSAPPAAGTSGSASKPAFAPIPAPVAAKPVPAPAASAANAERRRLVAEAAYYIAERRGFAPGNDVQDWLAAERTVDAQLRRR